MTRSNHKSNNEKFVSTIWSVWYSVSSSKIFTMMGTVDHHHLSILPKHHTNYTISFPIPRFINPFVDGHSQVLGGQCEISVRVLKAIIKDLPYTNILQHISISVTDKGQHFISIQLNINVKHYRKIGRICKSQTNYDALPEENFQYLTSKSE